MDGAGQKVTKKKDTSEPSTLSRYASGSAGKPRAHIPVRPFALPLAALTLRFSGKSALAELAGRMHPGRADPRRARSAAWKSTGLP
jgi:hypothetical protein